MAELKYRSGTGKLVRMPTQIVEPLTLSSAVLIDMHSLDGLCSDALKGRLTSPGAIKRYIDDLTGLDEDLRCHVMQILDVLSTFICFDKVILDARAVQSFLLGHVLLDTVLEFDLAEHVILAEFPENLYREAALQVLLLRKGLQTNNDGSLYLESLLNVTPYAADDYILKDMCDGYRNHRFEKGDFGPVFNLGNTGESVERLFLYLELARWADVPATLSARKYGAAVDLGAGLSDFIAKRTIDNALRTQLTALVELQETLANCALGVESISLPPLPGHILQVAQDRCLSLLDAALWIRNSPGAAAFRAWFWKARRSFDPVFASDVLAKQMLEKELHALGSKIAAEGAAEGIFMNRSTLAVRLPIPVIGPVLKAFGLDKINLPLVSVRHRDMYEIFMASWFSPTGRMWDSRSATRGFGLFGE